MEWQDVLIRCGSTRFRRAKRTLTFSDDYTDSLYQKWNGETRYQKEQSGIVIMVNFN